LKRILAILAVLTLSFGAISASASDGLTYQSLGSAVESSSGLTVTLNSLSLADKPGSVQLTIGYTQRNNTSDKKLDEGSFKLFFTDGSSQPQFGFFNSFFPGDGNSRSYTWEWLKGKEPWLIEWDAGFFAAAPSSPGLKWKVGTSYPSQLTTPTPIPSVKPTPIVQPTPTVEPTPMGKTSVDLRWVGTKLTISVKNGPVPSTVKVKIGNKLLSSKIGLSKTSYSFVSTVAPSTVASIYLNGTFLDVKATPGDVANCKELWKMFDGGLTPYANQKNKGSNLKKKPTVHWVGAVSNERLDSDKDGLVCER
jgi:hypothetical protein